MLNTDLGRLVLSTIGALAFTLTVVGAAVSPAYMVETGSVSYASAAPQVGGGVNV